MPIVKPAVVLISSDDEGDGKRILDEKLKPGHPDVVLISSDDEDDGERNFEKGLESGHDGGNNKSDKDKEIDVEKSNEGECLDNCDERRDKSDPFSQGGNDLQELSLYECKTYLRKHGIRVSGTKEECIQRIKEHERLKDRKGEALYPRSSFFIDCTGDVCKGDVVLFRQNIYNSQRDIIGSRTVAGRIVKESYGLLHQQHTFSVEVLWSKWSNKLEPLSILLVKGRNLYRFGTFRQRWESEAERLKVLREKHERGRAARLARKLRENRLFASSDVKGLKLHKNTPAHNLAVRFQTVKLNWANQLTYHSPPNHSTYSHYNSGQGPNHAFHQPHGPLGHRGDNYIPPIDRLTNEEIRSHFPRSSFSIKCTDDARKGDIVLFKQNVYVRKSKAEKKRKVGDKRIVAGRILKVRQFKSKEKLNFMIQVLWTKHTSTNLRPRSKLIVRSHILYKFGTFRQPWKNEANRSKMLKHGGQLTGKRKLKKQDNESNKNKGVKRQKVSPKEPSPSKHKPSKKKSVCASATPVTRAQKRKSASASANATPVTRAQKRKAARLLKKKLKKVKHLEPSPNPADSNLDLSPNPDMILSTNSKKGSCHNLNPNTLQNPLHKTNAHQNTCVDYDGSATPARGHKRKAACLKRQKLKKLKHKEPHANSNTKSNSSLNPCMVSSTSSNKASCPNRQNSNPKTLQNPNQKPHHNPNLRPTHNPCNNSEPRQNPNLNTHQKPNPNMSKNSNLSTLQNPNPNQNQNPHPNGYIYGHHQQLSSSSFSYDRCMVSNPAAPPSGYMSNQPQPPAGWFDPNQGGFSGYGGQWGHNQPPGYYDYNWLVALGLISLLCQQTR